MTERATQFVERPEPRKTREEIQAWIDEQRRLYREGKLSRYKIARLNSVGFQWEPQSAQPGPAGHDLNA